MGRSFQYPQPAGCETGPGQAGPARLNTGPISPGGGHRRPERLRFGRWGVFNKTGAGRTAEGARVKYAPGQGLVNPDGREEP